MRNNIKDTNQTKTQSTKRRPKMTAAPSHSKKPRRANQNRRNAGNVWLIIILAIAAVFTAVLFVSYLQQPPEVAAPETLAINLYFKNISTNALEPESHTIAKGDPSLVLQEALEALKAGPKAGHLAPSIPEGVEIPDVKIYVNKPIAEVTLSDSYKDLSANDELFCRASLVWSLTELDFIEDVHIYVGNEELLKSDGTPMGLLNRENVRIQTDILPVKTEEQVVTLYFGDEQGLGLVPESHTVTVSSQPIEYYIIEALIKGPLDSNHHATLPSETKIGSVETKENICYVDLNADFINKFTGGSTGERLAVYSIVNSLTELSNIKRVQILIEGNKVNAIQGHLMDISSSFERDESLILE